MRKFAYDFLIDVVDKIPQKSGTLKAETVLNWIEPRKSGNVLSLNGSCDWVETKDEYITREREFIKGA